MFVGFQVQDTISVRSRKDMLLTRLLKKSSTTSSKFWKMSASSASGFGKRNWPIVIGDNSLLFKGASSFTLTWSSLSSLAADNIEEREAITEAEGETYAVEGDITTIAAKKMKQNGDTGDIVRNVLW